MRVEVFLESTQESVDQIYGPALHAVLKGDGPYFPGRTGAFARAEAAEVFLEFTQESVAILLEQLFMRFSKVRDHAVQDDLDLLRVLKHLKYF